MMRPALRLFAAAACSWVLLGCEAGIGLKTDFAKKGFEVGSTTRDQVVETLGLPQRILKDDDGRAHLFYEGATHLIGACIGCGIPAPVGAIPSLANAAQVKNGAEYVFDDKNVLVAKFEPKKK